MKVILLEHTYPTKLNYSYIYGLLVSVFFIQKHHQFIIIEYEYEYEYEYILGFSLIGFLSPQMKLWYIVLYIIYCILSTTVADSLRHICVCVYIYHLVHESSHTNNQSHYWVLNNLYIDKVVDNDAYIRGL